MHLASPYHQLVAQNKKYSAKHSLGDHGVGTYSRILWNAPKQLVVKGYTDAIFK